MKPYRQTQCLSVCIIFWSENTRNSTALSTVSASWVFSSLYMPCQEFGHRWANLFVLPLAIVTHNQVLWKFTCHKHSTSAAHIKVCHSGLCAVFSFLICLEQTTGTFTSFCVTFYTPTLARKDWSGFNASTVLAGVPALWWSTREKHLQLGRAANLPAQTAAHTGDQCKLRKKKPSLQKLQEQKQRGKMHTQSLRIAYIGKDP